MRIAIQFILSALLLSACSGQKGTEVSIEGEKFFINGKPTYQGVQWKGYPIEGLLMNSRMVQATFDDSNPETSSRWKYPDTQEWDPERNTREFVENMAEWYRHGVIAVTINMQGGSPMGYGNKGWINTAFEEDGSLKAAYMERLAMVLDKADELGMVIILGYFYFGQDQYLADEEAVIAAVNNATDWILEKGYRNTLIEINNECDAPPYDHDILRPDRVLELINLVKSKTRGKHRLLVSTSFGGMSIPTPNVVNASDFILIHGNGAGDPEIITRMVKQTRQVEGYRHMPVLFNEDDHYDYDRENFNYKAAIEEYASWGYFDFRRQGEGFEDGFQSVPVDWRISSERKKAFFEFTKELTGF